MKKIIIALCLSLIVTLSMASCTKNDDSAKSRMRVNDGKITETGTDTNIINRAETMLDDMMSR